MSLTTITMNKDENFIASQQFVIVQNRLNQKTEPGFLINSVLVWFVSVGLGDARFLITT